MDYQQRRHRLMSTVGEGLVVVRGRGPEGASPNLIYLTGVAEPAATLVLAPAGVRIGTGRKHPGPDYVRGRVVRQVLFLPAQDPLAARWGEDSAASLGSVEAHELGLDAVLPTGELMDLLSAWLASTSAVHLVRGFPASLSAPSDPDAELAERIRSRFLGVTVHDATPAIQEMRRVKDPAEQQAVLRAIDVTRRALDAVVGRMAQVELECELEAEISRVYRARGARHAFEPIVGCGPNALKLHYTRNDGAVRSGELLLVDTGAVLQGYRSDITRTFPVGGSFSPRQRQVYEAVLRAQTAAIEECRPGARLGDVHARAFEVVARAGFGGAEFPHGIGHHLGLDTHDVGDAQRPLEPGCVVTIEPGLYLADEGIGVRIEDDVLVTASGPRILSEAIPRGADEIEAWIARGRAS